MLPPTGAKGLGETDEEIEANLWANLLIDPLFELRLASLKQSGGPVIAAPGQMLTSEAIKTKLRAINFGGVTPSGGLSMQQIKAAAAWLADGDGAGVLTDAAAAISDPNDPALVGAVARAVVAYALEQGRGEIGTGPNALYIVSERDALVEQVARDLSGGVKGLGDWLFRLALKFAEAQATTYGKDRRAGLMTSVSPGVGDILLYERRGQAISSLLKTEVGKLTGDIYVIGHSLGGICLVDMLSGPNRPANVKKLITVGSQSPFFFACDALETLRLGRAPSTLFTPWLNIFDRNDFLSFCATRSFGGVAGIEDFEVASGVPFPDSHGAYWRMKEVYAKIAEFCP